MRFVTGVGLCLVISTVLATRASHAAPASRALPVVAARFTSGKLLLNGTLSQQVWQSAPRISLTQQSPDPGAPTSFNTTVRILRGQNHLYFAIVCDDPNPAKIAIHSLQRDADQSSDDNVMIVLDPFDQHKLGYVFQVNAGGGMADGLISPGYYNYNSNTPAVDYSWNGYWEAVVKRSSRGWTAEIRINTESLQFNDRNDVWGLNISRYVPRRQLTLAWSGINLNASVTNLQWEGELAGMRGMRQGSRLEFDPYAVSDYSSTRSGISGWSGFDVNYDITPALAARFTYHTDFSEAKPNTLDATISPYPQSIPETRQFFLDGANVFTFSHNLGQNFIPFYSENVGVVDGETVPLDEGAKVLGDVGNLTLGLLDAQMASSGASNATNLFAGRAVYNLNNQWRVGTLLTHGDPYGLSNNTLVSFDSTWSTSRFDGDQSLNLSAWGARSYENVVPKGAPYGYGLDIALPNDLWWIDANYNYFGDALDPAMGFLQRPGTKQTFLDVNWQPRPRRNSIFSWVRQFDIYGTYRYVTNLDNQLLSEEWQLIPLQWTTKGGWTTYVNIRPSYEVLTTPYEIVPSIDVPSGMYHFTNVAAGFGSPTSNPWQITLEIEGGDLYGGHYRASYPQISWSAPDGKLSVSLQPIFIWFYSHHGDGDVRAESLNSVYSFTPRLSLSTLIEYDNISRTTSVNARLQWQIRSDRVLYLVWNHGLRINPNLLQGSRTITGDTVIAKIVWGFR
jgi:hypothetical protein